MSTYAWKWVRPKQLQLATVRPQTSPSEVSRTIDEELDALDYVVPYMEGPSSWERIKEVNDQSYSGYKDRENWMPWMCASCNSWAGPEQTCLDCGDSNTEQIRYPRAYKSIQPAFHNIYGRDDYFRPFKDLPFFCNGSNCDNWGLFEEKCDLCEWFQDKLEMEYEGQDPNDEDLIPKYYKFINPEDYERERTVTHPRYKAFIHPDTENWEDRDEW